MSQTNTEVVSRYKVQQIDDEPTVHTTKYETRVPHLNKIHILILSLITSFFSVANPLFLDAANGLQSQNLYIGMMLTKGQIPYSDVFTSGGMVYFFLIALSFYLGTSWWLVLIEGICFYLSGLYFYKLINYFTGHQKVASAFSLLFYLMILIIGFGGLYPLQFVLPFVLISLWFLTKYFANLVKDEAFVLFGFAGALSMLVEPRTLIFWALAIVAIIVFNIKERHFARGGYQLLAAIFGMLLVFYTAGYFVLNLQILGPYLSQAVSYQFSYFRVGDLPLIVSFLVQLAFVFGLGLLTGMVNYFKNHRETSDHFIKWLLSALICIYAVLAIFSQDYATSVLLYVLPFGLVLTSIPIGKEYDRRLQTNSHRRGVKHSKGTWSIVKIYFAKHCYLPLIVLIVSLVMSGRTYLANHNLHQSRHQVASYLAKNVKNSQQIYVWDTSSQIYLESQKKVASQIASPSVNFKKNSHKKILEDELLQDQADFIVLNTTQKLPDRIKKIIRKKYKPVRSIDVSSFRIYRKK
ncbi:DUF2079 domain-containing protein [Streptococcus didelphis]|uniref:hypothetical protein n=1 Tax=Streptococcus didelphis TaxID=102886 RepID=UPI000361A7EE|nr:hypothetical protein [Streptococcus didelphis]